MTGFQVNEGPYRGSENLVKGAKGGAPYTLHPLRVMLQLGDLREMMAGLLHDAVEDPGVTLDQLRRTAFTAEPAEAVDALTRRPGEEYREYLARVKANPMALRLKLANLRENLDESRIPEPTGAGRRRREKYRRALAVLAHEGA